MNQILNFLMTPNKLACDLLMIPLMLIDTIVNMLLFTTILNVKPNKKQKKLYILSLFVIATLIKLLLKNTFNQFICLIVAGILIYTILKVSVLKSTISIGIIVLTSSISEIIVISILRLFIDLDYYNATITPFYRLLVNMSIYLLIYFIYKIIKFFKINTKIIDNMSKKSKKLLVVNSILGIILILPYMIFVNFFKQEIPALFLAYTLFSNILFFIINIYTLIKNSELEITKNELENAELYNKTLSILYDNIRTFRHDFNNMIQVIGGYIMMKDINGLEKYHSGLLEDCQKVNNLSALNPETINNPPIFGLLASKYHIADAKGIKINFEIFINLNSLKMDIYKFTKILGILLDNSLEAAEECEEKIVNILMRQDINTNMQIITIENTYKQKEIDIAQIYDKDFSTKNRNSGIGLWEVKQMVNKLPNVNLLTTKNDTYFKQTLEIS